MCFIKKAAKNAILCASFFAATALGALAQNVPSSKQKAEKNFLSNTEFMFLFRSFHTDRMTPFNENNFGIFAKHTIGRRGQVETSVMQGVYYNSNYTCTPTIGALNEVKFGRFGLGLLAGVALYPRVQKDEMTCKTVYAYETPKNESRRGYKKTYFPTSKPYEYVEVEKKYRARGIRNKFRLIPALLSTFSYDAYRGSGPFATATYVPWKSGDHHGLGIFAFGARINPTPHP